jgi:hypothetical protein
LKLQIIESNFASESGAEEPSREEPTDNDWLAVPLATQHVHYLYFNNYKIMVDWFWFLVFNVTFSNIFQLYHDDQF